jgi:hypothetical protein
MSQSGYTPIQLYRTSTAAAAPTAGNLAAGELAINLTDEKLYFKNAAGTVKLLASSGSADVGGSNTQVQYNNSGVLGGSANFVFNGTNVSVGGVGAFSIPNTRLSITSASANAYLSVYGGTGSTDGGILLGGNNAENFANIFYSTSSNYVQIAATPAGSQIKFDTAGSERMRIDASGNVGIGTSSPIGRMEVVQSSGTGNVVTVRNTNSGQFFIGGVSMLNAATANNFGVTIGTGVRDVDGTDSFFTINKVTSGTSYVSELAYYDLSAEFWKFSTNNTERMRITSEGFLEATYSDDVVALGNSGTATSIDLRQGNVFTATLTGNCTFTLTNPNANSNRGSSFTLILTNDGTAGRTVAWAGGTFRFPGGAAALGRTTTANAVDIWVFFTPDNGTTYYGNIAMKNMIA